MPIEIYKETRVAQQARQLANAIASTRGMNDEFYTIMVFLVLQGKRRLYAFSFRLHVLKSS